MSPMELVGQAAAGELPQGGLLFDPRAPSRTLRTFYRWGWLPLVAGCVVLMAAGMLLSELLFSAMGLETAPRARSAYIIRGVTLSVLLAAWVGWYVLMARRRIEGVREQLRAQQVALAEQAWRAEQTIGLGALSRVLAHEIRSPLHSIALSVTLLRKRAQSADPLRREELLKVAAHLEEEVARLDGLLQDYMEYANLPDDELTLRPVSLRAAIDAVLATQGASFDGKGVTVALEVPAQLPPLQADPTRIRQLLSLLVRNALESTAAGGQVRISVREEPLDLRLAVWHDGPALENAEEVFRPFFSGRRGNSGLALAIVRDVIRAHGGDVSALGGAQGGLEISVRLPKEHG